mmetsp:Transcript_25314/g.65785  ORF Transcript_25314/g.65785 Transcript_25314/m.65785 type:complete len:391 (+) Transcript_25314:1427-2599(+)
MMRCLVSAAASAPAALASAPPSRDSRSKARRSASSNLARHPSAAGSSNTTYGLAFVAASACFRDCVMSSTCFCEACNEAFNASSFVFSSSNSASASFCFLCACATASQAASFLTSSLTTMGSSSFICKAASKAADTAANAEAAVARPSRCSSKASLRVVSVASARSARFVASLHNLAPWSAPSRANASLLASSCVAAAAVASACSALRWASSDFSIRESLSATSIVRARTCRLRASTARSASMVAERPLPAAVALPLTRADRRSTSLRLSRESFSARSSRSSFDDNCVSNSRILSWSEEGSPMTSSLSSHLIPFFPKSPLALTNFRRVSAWASLSAASSSFLEAAFDNNSACNAFVSRCNLALSFRNGIKAARKSPSSDATSASWLFIDS